MPIVFERAEALKARPQAPRATDCVSAISECALLKARFATWMALPSCIPGIPVRKVRVIAVSDGLQEALNPSPKATDRH